MRLAVVEVLGAVAIIGSGICAGVFFAVAVSVMPTLFKMPPGQYIVVHGELGKGYHPVMPLVVSAGLIADVILIFLAPDTLTRVLFIAAVVSLIGVQVVSQFGNVPINKRVQAMDPQAVPADWADPRSDWRGWHRWRTTFALLALALNAFAVALV